MAESHTNPSGNGTKEAEAKEEERGVQIGKPARHHKETHGTSDDIDKDTPVDEVKGPSVLHRVKEEVEAIVEAIHSKKDS